MKTTFDITDFNRGEESAFKFIFDTYYRRILYYINKLSHHHADAEDMVITVFYRVFRSIKKGTKYESEKHVSNVLYFACRRVFSTYSNKRTIILGDIPEEGYEPLRVETELLNLMYKEIKGLPEKCKTVMELSLKGFSPLEMSEKLGRKPQTILNQYTQGVGILRDIMVLGKERPIQHTLTINGVTKSLKVWCQETNVSYQTALSRIYAGYKNEHVLKNPA